MLEEDGVSYGTQTVVFWLHVLSGRFELNIILKNFQDLSPPP